jgi:hypothetical protein
MKFYPHTTIYTLFVLLIIQHYQIPYTYLLSAAEQEAKNNQRSPQVSSFADKTTRHRNVFEALYADAGARRENLQKKREESGY